MTPISEREIGVIEQKINNLEHRIRNDKMIVNGLVDEISLIRLELTQFKYKAYGISSAILFLLGGLSWIIDFLKGV
jgi:wobble nucleotide-excising tRNase